MKEQLIRNSAVADVDEMCGPCNHFYGVEFSLRGPKLLYQSKLWSRSPESIFVLVKEDSDVLDWIEVGDILDMTYYSNDELCPTTVLNTKIQYITRDDGGQFRGHYMIGLTILSGAIKN